MRVVEIDALTVAVDHRADETVLADRALQFLGRGVGRAHRQGGEAGQAVGILVYRGGELVVAGPGEAHGGRSVHLLHSGRRQRQHSQVDAGVVHGRDARVAEVE